ncbi:hypothetical protein [Actinoplanes sp. TBRC 11911]|uniref:hypothetical protein n=1 Tax=Actinoplanes sp. TBRC 11911 TaxID=2729386 RepID=UPI00200712F5|nr:hypothetical protein [Actinoplanes sp. TBRC 11911]
MGGGLRFDSLAVLLVALVGGSETALPVGVRRGVLSLSGLELRLRRRQLLLIFALPTEQFSEPGWCRGFEALPIGRRDRLGQLPRIERRMLNPFLQPGEVDVVVDVQGGLQELLKLLQPGLDIRVVGGDRGGACLGVQAFAFTFVSRCGTLSCLGRLFSRPVHCLLLTHVRRLSLLGCSNLTRVFALDLSDEACTPSQRTPPGPAETPSTLPNPDSTT